MSRTLLRIDDELVPRLDVIVEAMSRDLGVKLTRTRVMNMLLTRALRELGEDDGE